MAVGRILSYVSVLCLGAALPLLLTWKRAEDPCSSTDPVCFETLARGLLEPDALTEDGPDSLLGGPYGFDVADRLREAREALQAGTPPGPVAEEPVGLPEIRAWIADGSASRAMTGLVALRRADPSLRDAALDLFETEFDALRTGSSREQISEMLFWLSVNDIERLARIISFTDIDLTMTQGGFSHTTTSQSIRAALIAHGCQSLARDGKTPDSPLADRLKLAKVRDSGIALRVYLSCEGEAAALAFMRRESAWISASNQVLIRNFTDPEFKEEADSSVVHIAETAYGLGLVLAKWHMDAGRWGAARKVFEDWSPQRIAAPLSAIGPEVFARFDHQFLSWTEFVELAQATQLDLPEPESARSGKTLAYIATEFTPSFRPYRYKEDQIDQALAVIAREWPSDAAGRALFRLARLAAAAAPIEPLRLKTLLKLAILERHQGCPLPLSLLQEAHDRAAATGLGGARLPWLDRAEIAILAARLLRSPVGPAPKAPYSCSIG